MVAVANPEREIDISSMMELYKKTHEKLEKFRKWEIPHIQSKLDKEMKKNGSVLNPKKAERMKAQLTLLHHKEQKLMKEIKRQALMIYLFIAYKTGGSHLSWDSIGGLSTKGTSGALAQAITYLPKQKAHFDIFRQWAEDLKRQDFLPNYEDTTPVSSFTSQVCAFCFQQTGTITKTLVKGLPYDQFRCKKCGKTSNRHSNSAQTSALLLEQYTKCHNNSPSPLTMG